MASVSLCMIVKDEEEVLDRCLSCFGKLADEIVIVDTGSGDRTKEIAGNYTDRIYDFVGVMIFLPPGITDWKRRRWSTVCGLMQTM